MTKLHLPHDVWVLVGDGRRALLLRNHGDVTFPDLRVVRTFEDSHNPASAAQGTDRPGRSMEHSTGRRSGMDETDWHVQAEQRFAEKVAGELGLVASTIASLIVVAPPRTLAQLRSSLNSGLRKKVLAEVNKDLTRHPVHEIESILSGRSRG
jgi:protein required for attachment to host cells